MLRDKVILNPIKNRESDQTRLSIVIGSSLNKLSGMFEHSCGKLTTSGYVMDFNLRLNSILN